MAAKKSKPKDGAPGAPAWMVTFSDCMTLLLTFFVLLLCFSSFDEQSRGHLDGIFDEILGETISDNPSKRASLLKPRNQLVDRTRLGAEKPDMDFPEGDKNPTNYDTIIDVDLYADWKEFYIPADRMFVGNSGVPTQRGQGMLDQISGFMRQVPGRVIVAHRLGGSGSEVRSDRVQARALSIVRYLTAVGKVPPERIGLATGDVSVPSRYKRQNIVKIVLMNSTITN